jgi:hypothetical protein
MNRNSIIRDHRAIAHAKPEAGRALGKIVVDIADVQAWD